MRAFVAIEVSDSNVLESIKKVQLECDINAKPIESDKIHFTLMFLGDITDVMVEKIKKRLDSIDFSPFIINFSGVGAFPKPKFPRVIWIGVDEGAKELMDLAKKVQQALLPLGFTSDKLFKPHVTILRVKNRVDVSEKLLKYTSTQFGNQKINDIKFKQSVLTPQGPIYSDIQVVKAKQ